MSLLNVVIDQKALQVESGTTILEAAEKVGIKIPTLCYMNLHGTKMKNQPASCRICVVEVEGRRNLAPACATLVTPDMVVRTNTKRVLAARKMVMELLLSDHPKDCLSCVKSGECELQDVAKTLGIREECFKGAAQSTYAKDIGIAITRDMNKCIRCRRCETTCQEVQSVGALSAVNRGFEAIMAPAFEVSLSETKCTYCGQCIAVCPTGALSEHEAIEDVKAVLEDHNKIVVVQVAPAVRAALGEAFGMPADTLVTGKMAAALRRLGFDYVFDTDFAADVTIMEEGYELIDRLQRLVKGDTSVKLPLLTSCCPGWINFIETQYPELLEYPSTTRSPQQIFGAITKSYFAEKLNIPVQHLVVVSVMPCVAKKFEAARSEFGHDVDISITTRELARLIEQSNIKLEALEDEDFDQPLGTSTGAAVIFGTTGGVIEAAIRTAYEKLTGETLEKVEFECLRGMEGIREATIQIGETSLHIGIVHGLSNARQILEGIKAGNKENFHAIEVMACPGGCIGGGGQPYHHGDCTILEKRQEALYEEDRKKEIRKSHENPAVIELYENYLNHPLSHQSHELLHTYYMGKEKL